MSDKTPTERVRKMLDELGIEHYDHEDGEPLRDLSEAGADPATSWRMGGASVCAVPNKQGTFDLWIDNCTPEQAIAATVSGKDEWEGKPFVEYAEHVAKKLGDESFELMECCDEPDFSALDKIYGLCCDIIKAANTWRQGKGQYEDELDAERMSKKPHEPTDAVIERIEWFCTNYAQCLVDATLYDRRPFDAVDHRVCESMEAVEAKLIRELAEDIAKVGTPTCTMEPDGYYGEQYGIYTCSNCGELWQFDCDGPKEHGWTCCPKCRATIKEDE